MKLEHLALGISLLAILLVGLHFITDKDVSPLGGTTNLDSLSLGENLTVTGTSTLTGATTQTGALTVAGTLNADGKLDCDGDVEVTNFTSTGNISSQSNGGGALTAAQVCDNAGISMLVSASFTLTTPTSASLIADCLDNVGDMVPFMVYNHNASDQRLTISEGTGVEILASTNAGTTELTSNEAIEILFWRVANTSVSALIKEFEF